MWRTLLEKAHHIETGRTDDDGLPIIQLEIIN
jgi:hypothetical protein